MSKWTWINSSPSEDPESVSIAAILETFAATTALGLIVYIFGSYPLLVSACVSPLLLLRTQESTRLGLVWARSFALYYLRFTSVEREDRFLDLVLFLCHAPAALCIRAVATFVTLLRHPLLSLRAIPNNWWRHVSRIDCTTEPEAVPGAHADALLLAGFLPRRTFFAILKLKWETIFDLISAIIATALYMLTTYLPVLTFRWSVKGTTLFFSPFIYMVHTSFAGNPEDLFQDIKDLAYQKLMRAYAAVVLLISAVKLYVMVTWESLAAQWKQIPGEQFLSSYFVPESFQYWQIASVINAILTWVVFLMADFALSRLKRESKIIPGWISGLCQTMWFVRGALSLYSIAIVLYITMELTPKVNWPPIEHKLFPWSLIVFAINHGNTIVTADL